MRYFYYIYGFYMLFLYDIIKDKNNIFNIHSKDFKCQPQQQTNQHFKQSKMNRFLH